MYDCVKYQNMLREHIIRFIVKRKKFTYILTAYLCLFSPIVIFYMILYYIILAYVTRRCRGFSLPGLSNMYGSNIKRNVRTPDLKLKLLIKIRSIPLYCILFKPRLDKIVSNLWYEHYIYRAIRNLLSDVRWKFRFWRYLVARAWTVPYRCLTRTVARFVWVTTWHGSEIIETSINILLLFRSPICVWSFDVLYCTL